MPSPDDASIGIVKQYQTDMKSAGAADFDYTSLEGYVNAVILVEALKKAGAEPTRAALLGALESFNTDIGGVKVAYSAASHQGFKHIYFTQVKGGKAVPVSKF